MKKTIRNILLLPLIVFNIASCSTKEETSTNTSSSSSEAIKQITISFNTNGGTEIPSITIDLGSKINKPNNPNKDNYLFINWYSDINLQNVFDFDTEIKKDITLYAKWELNDKTGPNIYCDYETITTYVGKNPIESFKASDDVDGDVNIKYLYPDGMINNDRKLNIGNYNVTLEAQDKTNNVTTKNIIYSVLDTTALIGHPINIDATGCNINNLNELYYPNEVISFTVNNNYGDVSINIKDSDNKDISYSKKGDTYYLNMPNDNITITASTTSSYMNYDYLSAKETEFINYLGRHYKKDNGIFMSYSNSGFMIDVYVDEDINSLSMNVTGSSFEPKLSEIKGETVLGDQYLQMHIDGKREYRIAIPNGTNNIKLINNLEKGKHTIEFKKCNESQYSQIILNSLKFKGIKIKKHVENRKLIEIYGDSISCGYGILSDSNKESFYLSNEDSTLSYSQLIADKLGYRNSTIAISGIAMYLSRFYDPTNPDSYPYSMLDFYKTIDSHSYEEEMQNDPADIVIINLGSNDHAKYESITDEEEKMLFEKGFKNNLKTMLTTVLTNNPNTKIIFCYEMCYPLEEGLLNAANDAIEECKSSFETEDIYSLKFNVNNDAADGHPSREAQAIDAEILYQFIISHNLD